ncbi:hypothetical protein BJ546DRAFT_835277, partial [Cryomyces antarcticus]
RSETIMHTKNIGNRIESSRLYAVFLKLIRALQFLSAAISLGIFSSRVYKVYRLYKQLSVSNGAVEGILAAAVAYTIIVTLLQLLLKGGGPRFLRWLVVILDVAFVGGFITVAVLTRPNGGPSGPCVTATQRNNAAGANSANCKLPWGTFLLAILSTILHAITAVFHEVHDHHQKKKAANKLRQAEDQHSDEGFAKR